MKVYDNIKNVNTEFVKKDLSKKENKTGKVSGHSSEDSVEFSSHLNNLRELEQKASELSSIKSGKVDGIKLQVENGSYQISSENIAEKIVDELISK